VAYKDALGRIVKDVPAHLSSQVVLIWEERGYVFYMLVHDTLGSTPVLVKPIDDSEHPSAVIHSLGPRYRTHSFQILYGRWAYWLYS